MNWKDEGGFLNKDLNLWKAGCPAYDFYAKTEGSWVLHNHVFIIIIIIIYQIGNLFSKIRQIKELDKYIETVSTLFEERDLFKERAYLMGFRHYC